jgi:cation diffusion facilitator CzcD-associated flavoprotein CzcO
MPVMSADCAEARSDLPTNLDALIVGAGFSGLYQLHLLRDRLGLAVEVVEAASDIGGVWYWNRYPGARCDSESFTYCYTFSDELLRHWQWSERFAQPDEIRSYLAYVSERLDLRRSIRFSTRVVAAHFDEVASLWHVTTETGERISARFLIAATGCLSAANLPQIDGLASFGGEWYHTGEWPHGDVDFTGRRVGLIGTGSTGIQVAPVIAEVAAHLTVFQRTANYSVPARNAPLTPQFQAHLKENYAAIKALIHSTPNGHAFRNVDRSVFDVSPEERHALFEAAWAKGGPQFREPFRDLALNTEANDTVAEYIKSKIRDIVKDPETAAILLAIDHPYAAKRPPLDTGYFETFNRSNVSLVDLGSEPIETITPAGIQTQTREHALDVIVFATGFDAFTGALAKIEIRGRGDLLLENAWETGPVSYLGLQIAGFPNLFTVTGPGSPAVLVNMTVAIEQHVEWIADCIAHMRANGFNRIEAHSAAQDSWLEEVKSAADATLMSKVQHSWYLGANVPGKPRVFMPYAGGMVRYREICVDVARDGYRGFLLAH